MIGTLSLYIARRFFGAALAAFVSILLLVTLIDLVEQLRRSAGTDTGFAQVLELAILHAPALMLEILPFLVLIAAMACFSRLARASELVVTRAAGISVWRLITPAVVTAALLGVVAFGLLNPLSSGLLQRFERQEARWIKDRTSLLSISENGLWLRQAEGGGAQAVVHALRANGDGTQLWDATFFRFGPGDLLEGRIEATRAVLEPGTWTLYDVRRWRLSGAEGGDAPPNGAANGAANGEADGVADGWAAAAPAEDDASEGLPPTQSGTARAMQWEDLDSLTLPTGLTRAQILESFASPKTISFWELPGFIRSLEAAGVSSTRHRMHWQAQLAQPLLFAAMVLIGAAFSMRHARFGGLGLMALGAVGAGLVYFFLANVTQAFGSSGAIPAPLAAWIPPVAMTLCALGLLLHLEDG
ncbi:lipopolysaccharide export system permease protein [Albimonas donghaensis]|uniref:Lipopolysaccharide export system permease protein n=1 Tax=Albimonas donghaensis TaxID=356660 RepID=A0A1H2TB13_9RHOB|nr:LptF/LptG family permease [Albimonas donghaensis]SDW41040.1 lipopolysaccharide export system permease protein [Albimonas donghaensis]